MNKIVFESGIPESLLKSRSKLAKEFKLSMKNYMEILSSTENIDFGCELGLNGEYCLGYKKAPTYCCANCGYNSGWLNQALKSFGKTTKVFGTNKTAKFFNRHFDNEIGFWRKDKGCILPRKYRSMTCIFCNCLRDLGEKGRQRHEELLSLKGDAHLSLKKSIIIMEEWKKKSI